MALRLAKLFGNAAEFWLYAQLAVDLWDAARTAKDDLARIRRLGEA
jgi:plasmid maintenance system antidote protein VapI